MTCGFFRTQWSGAEPLTLPDPEPGQRALSRLTCRLSGSTPEPQGTEAQGMGVEGPRGTSVRSPNPYSPGQDVEEQA